MATIVCKREGCKFKKGNFCRREITMINEFGECDIWFDKRNGQLRPAPWYEAGEMPYDVMKQPSPAQEYNDGVIETEKNPENAEKD